MPNFILPTASETLRRRSADGIQLPSYYELCVETPLYLPVSLSPDDQFFLYSLRQNYIQFDAHCLRCGKSSTFKRVDDQEKVSRSMTKSSDWMFKEGFFTVILQCTRIHVHLYKFEFLLSDSNLLKIGQYPSMEDIAGAGMQKYRKILGNEYFSELHRATGLASHGIGIGAFVYLRRIFERLINQRFNEQSQDSKDAEKFRGLRMDEKIMNLSSKLPNALVANKATYSILSKGIHELDEDTCRTYFPAVRAAILLILEQDFQARESERAEKDIAAEIAKINDTLKK